MSSKNKTTATREEAKPALVPKLRFPAFRGAEGWNATPLGELGAIVTGKTPSTKENALWGGEIFFITPTDIKDNEKYQHTAQRTVIETKGTKVLPLGSVVYTCIASIGKMALTVVPSVTNQQINAIVPNDKTAREFIYYSLANLTPWIKSIPATSTLPIINKTQFSGFIIPHPRDKAEQQKIAECLSSVDELMAAQARKVDALKTHKKGLMQQLFPREGETQPRLRFPEFQNAGAWKVRTIGDMFDLINGHAFKPEDWKPTGTPIIRIQNLNDSFAEFNYSQDRVPERNRVESGNLLFAWSGTLGSSFGARIWNGPSGVLNQHIFKVLMDEEKIALQFALLVLARVEDDIARRTHGFKASFVHVKKSDLVKVELLLPSLLEQERIAACLSTLDALITAETQKLATLKTHKKGLMQQLFPSSEAIAK